MAAHPQIEPLIAETLPRRALARFGDIRPLQLLAGLVGTAGIVAMVVYLANSTWVAEQIKGARLEVFEENEGGAHFMFMENPQKFNQIAKDFNG